ncbi:MAG: saccharopine dehydrogenase-like NADP-dependent oxidoreductase [Bacteroidia bacterium]|jgi:saccharopine dehydrogenase-like NADP-dependent oxidoreductase
MKNILILGAGRSAFSLIENLLQNAESNQWHVSICDMSLPYLNERYADNPFLTKVKFSLENDSQLSELVSKSDIVISMLPARFHQKVAKSCLQHSKNMLTASYVSPEMEAMDAEAKEKGILFLNEMGLDPGIDHLSAMKIIDELKAEGAEITSFASFTGGLVAPESDNNPWNYKFTWNPRNVVLAGKGTAQYIQKGQFKYIPYHRLFSTIQTIEIDGCGEFEGYPNRDSLSYRPIYGLERIPTMLRGTLRKPGFCKSWNHFIQLGMTDDSYKLENSEEMTYRNFINTFLPYNIDKTVEKKVADFIGESVDGVEIEKLKWLGIFEETKIGTPDLSPAQALQQILEAKWTLAETDKDMIVMQHLFEYEKGGKSHNLKSSLVIMGEDTDNTAMAKGVGLPLAIGCKLVLNGKINLKGVQRPIQPSIYEPVLEELEKLGIKFVEKEEVN